MWTYWMGPEETPAIMQGLEPLCCEERKGELGLFSLGKSWDTLEQLPVPEWAYKKEGDKHFYRAS